MNQYPQSPWYPDAAGAAQFATHRVIDPHHQGMVVATFEHPQGWQAQSQVVWNFQDTSFPMTSYATVYNPRGTEAVEFLPTEACFWIEPPVIYTPGQRWRGLTCLPPMGALDALLQYAVPKYRGNRQNLRVAAAQPVPNMAQMLRHAWLLSVRNEGVMARLEYEENGRQFEEDFFACVMWHPPNGEQLNWGFARLFAFRAERGRLEAARQALWRVAASLETNPQWDQLFKQIMEQLHNQFLSQVELGNIERNAQKAWGRQMQEYREWESDLHRQTVDHRWASQDRINERRGEALGGYQRFHDPNSAFGVHRDYSLSQYSWTNGHRWIHRNDAMYDPNVDPNESGNGPWTLSKPL